MTFNNEVFHKTSAEVNTQVASYFDIVDNAVAMSDTNKNILLMLKLLILHQLLYIMDLLLHSLSVPLVIILRIFTMVSLKLSLKYLFDSIKQLLILKMLEVMVSMRYGLVLKTLWMLWKNMKF